MQLAIEKASFINVSAHAAAINVNEVIPPPASTVTIAARDGAMQG